MLIILSRPEWDSDDVIQLKHHLWKFLRYIWLYLVSFPHLRQRKENSYSALSYFFRMKISCWLHTWQLLSRPVSILEHAALVIKDPCSITYYKTGVYFHVIQLTFLTVLYKASQSYSPHDKFLKCVYIWIKLFLFWKAKTNFYFLIILWQSHTKKLNWKKKSSSLEAWSPQQLANAP